MAALSNAAVRTVRSGRADRTSMTTRTVTAEPFTTDLVAGTAAALVGLVSFGIFHTLRIASVPAVFVEGLLYVIPAALALAWAIRTTRRAGRCRGGAIDGLLVGGLLWLTVVPYEVVGAVWGPWPELTSFSQALPLLWIAFLGMPVGAALGWAITRQIRPAIAWAIAALAVDFSIAGGLAFFGGRGRFFELFLWLLPTHLAAGTVLVTVASRPGRAGEKG